LRRPPRSFAEGFRRAEVVVEETYRMPFVDHVYLETESGVGWIDAEGVLTLRVSTQVLEHFAMWPRCCGFRTAGCGSRARISAGASAARRT
jgi:hypothetical protein